MALSNFAHSNNHQGITELAAHALNNKQGGLAYSGDVSPEEAYAFMQSNQAMLVDVRTTPEWQFIGVPDVSSTTASFATISWKNYPDFSSNPKFTEQLSSTGASFDTPLFFLCRSGGRSLDAAVAMTAAGYRYSFNITGGFEGDPDAHGHRGITSGWKAKNLPWKQG